MDLQNNLRKFRFEHQEMTQEALANAAGVTRQTIISIEKGRFIPSTLLALRIAAVFDTTVEKIFFLADDVNATSERT